MKKRIITIGAIIALGAAVFGVPPFKDTPSAKGLLGESGAAFETGIVRLSGGTYQVSALTPMPGVTPEMVRWWFGDYMMTTEHYKRWHPEAHLWMDWENKRAGEYIGASHLVHEYIGSNMQKLRIQFVPPKDILGDTIGGDAVMGASDVAVCARVGLLEQPINVAKMCHIIVKTPEGAEMRSRFWMGHVAKRDGNDIRGSVEGILGNTALARVLAIRKSDAKDLQTHAEEEMGILAGFLPGLYADENGSP